MSGPINKTSASNVADADRDKSMNQGDLLHDNHSGYGGDVLRAEREKAGVDIPTLSFELRIPKNYLIALEAEDYDELPGTTYGFGYIKSYCKYLGIDDTPFLDTYKMRTAMSGRGPSYHFPDEALEPRMSGAMTAMLVVLALLSGYIGWQVYDRYAPFGETPPAVVATASVEAEPSATTSSVTSTADETLDRSVTQTASVEAPSSDTPSQLAQDDSVPEAVPSEDETDKVEKDATINDTTSLAASAEDEAASESDSAASQDDTANQVAEAAPQAPVAQSTAAQTTTSAQANVREPQEEIVISANSAAWVEVVSENGDVILSKLFQAGEEYIAPAEKKLYLSTGNAGGLVLMIPGLDSFQAGAVGEIIRDLPLSRESIRSRRSAVVQ